MRTTLLRLIGEATALAAGGVVVDSKALLEPNLRVAGKKPIGLVEINQNTSIEEKTALAHIFSQGNRHDELVKKGLVSLSGSSVVDKTGLVVDGATDRALGSANRNLFTGSKFTAILKFECGAISDNWTTVVGTDGNFIKLEVTTRSGLFAARVYIYIAGSYRLVSAPTISSQLPVGSSMWMAVTFDQPSLYCWIAENGASESFSKSALSTLGAPLDDSGGGLIFGASSTAGGTPATGKIELLYLSDKVFSEHELNSFKRDPYQFLKPVAQVSDLAFIGTSDTGGGSSITGDGQLASAVSQLSGAGTVESGGESITGDGQLASEVSQVSGAGVRGATGDGQLASEVSQLSGVGIRGATGDGQLVSAVSQLSGEGHFATTGDGQLASEDSQLSGTGIVAAPSEVIGDGQLAAQPSQLSGTGTRGATGDGQLTSEVSELSGEGHFSITGDGQLGSGVAELSGVGTRGAIGDGQLTAQDSQLAGTGTRGATGDGQLAAQDSQISGEGDTPGAVSGSGQLAAQDSQLSGIGVRGTTGNGQLISQASQLSGSGTVGAPPPEGTTCRLTTRVSDVWTPGVATVKVSGTWTPPERKWVKVAGVWTVVCTADSFSSRATGNDESIRTTTTSGDWRITKDNV